MILGLEFLANCRRAGYPIPVVTIHSCLNGEKNIDELNVLGFGCTVTISDNENLRRADLRPLKGLPVEVTGPDADRVLKIAQACCDAGASRVIATKTEIIRGTAHTEWLLDTDGVLANGSTDPRNAELA